MNCVSYGIPDFGNIRSTKRKDVRLRIKCIQALLLQHKKDLEFRQSMKDKGKLVEDADTQVLREKLARYETSLQQEVKTH
jgi:hypothetical protein|tara:strand:- start:628 stop:867 length:240 start_codon:yes stop_codon:yes gene_type:complete